MKSLPVCALALISSLFVASSALALDPIAELLSEAQTAYLRNDIAGAKAKFESVNKLDPKNQVAIGYLKQINAREADKGVSQEPALAKLIMPSVQFREASLSAALESLKQQVAKLTAGKMALNFVLQMPEEAKAQPVTLNLNNVPFTEVAKYVGAQANVSFQYDKYAILVRSTAPAKEAKADAPALPPQ